MEIQTHSLSQNKDMLKRKLANFNPEFESELDTLFKGLAESFLYGGYISVADHKEERYRIFIRTVEFYCHYEGDKKGLPKDPIVYHRNGRYVDGDVPYFPLMAFHAHASGYDITFEKEQLGLRSSALIRAYEVYDVAKQMFLIYDTKDKIFKTSEDNKRVNKQSTYLYNFLNGFVGDNIKWIDEARVKSQNIKPASRQNVFEYDLIDGIWVKSQRKDTRPWSFTRMEEIPD